MDDADHAHQGSQTPEPRPDHRQTAPQAPYTSRQAGIGFLVALLGMVLVFVVPLLVTIA